MSDNACVRCSRAAPAWGDPSWAAWESVGEDGETICPRCLGEHREIDGDAMAMAAEALGFGSRGGSWGTSSEF